MFSKRHPMAGRAPAPAFDQRRPAPLSRFRTTQLQALSRCRIRPASRGGFRFPRPASGCVLILSVHAFRLPRPPAAPSTRPNPGMSPRSNGPRENGPAESPRSCPLRASPAPLSRIDERAVARIIERGPALNSGHARKGRGCRPIHGRRREAVFAAFADAPENPVACLPGPSGRGSSAGRSSGARRPGVGTESHRRASSGRHPIIHAKGLPYC